MVNSLLPISTLRHILSTEFSPIVVFHIQIIFQLLVDTKLSEKRTFFLVGFSGHKSYFGIRRKGKKTKYFELKQTHKYFFFEHFYGQNFKHGGVVPSFYKCKILRRSIKKVPFTRIGLGSQLQNCTNKMRNVTLVLLLKR